MQQIFPEDIECILQPIKGYGGIYVSNIEVAENPKTLKKFGIEAVISAVKGKNLDSLLPRHIEYLYIPAVDHESFDISFYFEESNKFIDQERKRTNVLVHCMAGISRSVTLIIAYLIRYMNKTFDEAYNYMKIKRKIMHPNDAFLDQLRLYDRQLKNTSPSQKNSTQKPNRMIIDSTNTLKQSKSSQYRIPSQVKRNRLMNNNYDENLKQNIKNLFKIKSPGNSRIIL